MTPPLTISIMVTDRVAWRAPTDQDQTMWPNVLSTLAPNLTHTAVLLAGGLRDAIIPPDNTESVAAMLTSFGADIEVHWHVGGHELGQDDLNAAKVWLSRKTDFWQNASKPRRELG